MDYFLEEIKFSPEKAKKFLQSNALFYCVVALLVLKIAALAASVNFPQNIFFADITKNSLEILANQTRQSLGLGVLTDNPQLDQAAREKAEDMVKNGYFAHTSPTGITPWHWFKSAGYTYKYAGENLAIGFFDSTEVFNAWMNSPSHKENLLNPNYKEVGTAVLGGFGGNNTIVVVQLFGSQLPAKASSAAQVAKNTTQPATKPVTKPTTEKPAETAKPVTQPVAEKNTAKISEKVLSQSTEVMTTPTGEPIVENNLRNTIINALLYNNIAIIQNVIYGVALVLIGTFILLIFFSNEIKIGGGLAVRATLMIAILALSLTLDRGAVINMIPHNVII